MLGINKDALLVPRDLRDGVVEGGGGQDVRRWFTQIKAAVWREAGVSGCSPCRKTSDLSEEVLLLVKVKWRDHAWHADK